MTTRGLTLGMMALIALAAITVADAKTVTRCGASEGFRYDVLGPLSKGSAGGWSKDRISSGEFALILDGEEVDIIVTDVAGTRSSKADGATVLALFGDQPGKFIVIAAYSTGTLEHYLFSLSPAGVGEVVWGTSRAQGLIPKSSLMRAPCKAP